MTFVRSLPLGFALLAGAAAHAQISPVTVDLSQSGRSRTRISPLVYGANFASPTQAHDLNLPLNRNGGNATSRYNWQQDSTSSGADWYFMSHLQTGGSPSRSVDDWIQGNMASGVPSRTLSMVSIPIMGYVANVGPDGVSWSFSVAKYGAQQATEPWHPDDGNGFKPNGTMLTGNNPLDANMAVTIDYQQGWLNHLVSTFGQANAGGVSYYLLDNEPALWYSSHRDVYPVGVTMGSLFTKERDAALLAKSVDPTALVCGPEEWGWLGYLYSGADEQWLEQHNWQGTPPDRAANGGTDCAPFLLRQFAAASATAGKRLLDVFTLHYYSQGNFSSSDNGATAAAWRARCTRSLWDPNYTDESWINAKIDLIPRMKSWVTANYPGTKIGITEYNWGDDNNMSAAIAQADSLGIYGRDGVDLATRWVCPEANTATYWAMKIFRNYDGANSTFGDLGFPITTPDPDTLSMFGSTDSATHQTKIMFVHKRTTGIAPVIVPNYTGTRNQRGRVYQVTSGGLVQVPDAISSTGTFNLSLPPQSITILIYGQGI